MSDTTAKIDSSLEAPTLDTTAQPAVESKDDANELDSGVKFPQYFYVCSSEDRGKPSRKVFRFDSAAIFRISSYFRKYVEDEYKEGHAVKGVTAEDPYELEVTAQPNDLVSPQFKMYDTIYINTHALLQSLWEYTEIWKNNLDKEDYAKAEPVKVDNLAAALGDQGAADHDFILKLVQDEVSRMPKAHQDLVAENKHEGKYLKLVAVNSLLVYAEGYLGIDSLPKKLYIYSAIVMNGLSLPELSKSSGDPFFQQIYDKAIYDWSHENADRLKLIQMAEEIARRNKEKNERQEAKKLESSAVETKDDSRATSGAEVKDDANMADKVAMDTEEPATEPNEEPADEEAADEEPANEVDAEPLVQQKAASKKKAKRRNRANKKH